METVSTMKSFSNSNHHYFHRINQLQLHEGNPNPYTDPLIMQSVPQTEEKAQNSLHYNFNILHPVNKKFKRKTYQHITINQNIHRERKKQKTCNDLILIANIDMKIRSPASDKRVRKQRIMLRWIKFKRVSRIRDTNIPLAEFEEAENQRSAEKSTAAQHDAGLGIQFKKAIVDLHLLIVRSEEERLEERERIEIDEIEREMHRGC